MSLHLYEQYDDTIVVSKFHAAVAKQMEKWDGSLTVGANGIIPDQFPAPDESKRDPHACIYAAAPNRGLDFLFQAWPRIRAAVPDATLRVYYSWAFTEKQIATRPDVRAQLGPLLTYLRAKLEELKDQGVTYLGGVGHEELHEAYRTSSVWSYCPIRFEETFCISALKSQACGCWPVIVPTGALAENCPNGDHVRPHPGDGPVPMLGTEISEGFINAYADAVIHRLLNPPTTEERLHIRSYALEHSWDNAVDKFIEVSEAKNERITIYSGRFARQFDGVGSGDGLPLGGSEEAVIMMAKGLAAAGEDVYVYCHLPDGKARDDGTTVKWRDASDFNPAGPHGTLLAHRCPSLVPMLKGNGYPVILWLMDPQYGAAAYDYQEADDVVFLTEAHKGIIERKDGYADGGPVVHVGLPELPALGSVVREANTVMWATSPDRGLLEFLEEWPKVIAAVPDARLHIFYGLEPLEKNGKKELADAIRAKLALDVAITYHGGVSDAELVTWYQRCSVIVAPSIGFEETQGITICKAMALGCIPVVADQGALPEVLAGSVEDGGFGTVVYVEGGFTKAVIANLKGEDAASREAMAAYARERFSADSMVAAMLDVIDPNLERRRIETQVIRHSVLNLSGTYTPVPTPKPSAPEVSP